jgi:hypothetical protein
MAPVYNPFAPPIFPAQAPSSVNPMLAGRQPSPSYNTPLSPLDEFAYRQWVQANHVPTDPNSTSPQDYDMRGFYQGLQQGNPKARSAIDPNDNRLHFPDFWKTPLHHTFSNESQWAPASAPQWTPTDQLASQNGRVVFDDRAKPNGLLSFLGLK